MPLQNQPASAGFVPIDPDFESGGDFASLRGQLNCRYGATRLSSNDLRVQN